MDPPEPAEPMEVVEQAEPQPANDTLKPRKYQVQLMEIALKKNTIIFLPTGTGKTYIAVLVLKRMCESLQTPYSEGGKVSMVLVNTVALVDQHAKVLETRTNLKVGRYSGDMNLDFWPKNKWLEEFNKHQVFVMTVQILVNLVNGNYIDLNKVNLLIFDECHRGVSDQPMRQLCKSFEHLHDPPRVLGLTATLLNRNCSAYNVMNEVEALEVTYHAQVATVDGLEHVVGYSTNPKEQILHFDSPTPTAVESRAIEIINLIIEVVKNIKIEPTTLPIVPAGGADLKPLDKKDGLKKLQNSLIDLMEQIKTMGTYGGSIAVLSHMVQIERLKSHCDDLGLSKIFSYVQTNLICVRRILEDSMKGLEEKQKFLRFSSDKVIKLIHILETYKSKSKEELCGLIFTQKRFTAKIVNHILRALSQKIPEYSFIKSNFIIGNSNNPYNSTRESLYINKKNREVMQSFENKEINIMVASNVLEEGVDIPTCTLVVKFDKSLDYRSYIQSKGRARHKLSLYYMMVEKSEAIQFYNKYIEFQQIESILNSFLMGKNDERKEPSARDVQEMYNEDELEPYYANGPNSARVTMQSAIPLLNTYCDRLPHDIYTDMSPEYWFETKGETRITIVLPTLCPILEPIRGPYMKNIKSAKRAAALEACKMLHKIGELDDHLEPYRRQLVEDDIKYLFKHYPKTPEPTAGNTKHKRAHKKQIPKCISGPIKSGQTTYLHLIRFEPEFERTEKLNIQCLHDAFTSQLCYGLLTPEPLPTLCPFSVYTSLGSVKIAIEVNVKKVILSEKTLNDIKHFHVLVFNDIIKELNPFLVFDESEEAETLLLVPVDRLTRSIVDDVLDNYKEIKSVVEMSTEDKINLEVTTETYLNKIVAPWYRETGTYIVTEVSLNKSPLSPFPNEDFATYVDYYEQKHNRKIVNKTQPLLMVRGLTGRLNFFEPRGDRRSRAKQYDDCVEHLLPELCVKQEFPSCLWIQARYMPTILTRVSYLLRIEELRCLILEETGLGCKNAPKLPLEVDIHIKKYEGKKPEKLPALISNITEDETLNSSAIQLAINQDYVQKMLEAEYPWKSVDEPKDIERHLDVTVVDVDYYENFIHHKVEGDERLKDLNIKKVVPNHKQPLALTYPKDFIPKEIELLVSEKVNRGPDLRDLYSAFASAHANDIVNLERLETLGDSFLKYISSIYIFLRFPKFDEGRATMLKGRLVSNKNLFYHALKKNFAGIMRYNDLLQHDYIPPCFAVPEIVRRRIKDKQMSYSSLFHINLAFEEQVSGELYEETVNFIMNEEVDPDEIEEELLSSLASFFHLNYIGDKHVADTVEAAIGCYLEHCGLDGALKFVEWMDIIPANEKLKESINAPSPNPKINLLKTSQDVDFHIPEWRKVEEVLGYKFKNRAYLLQALTHSSYSPNRITHSYETLEFLGDAILDFLITCYIYENCGKLSPGELTDLRSALVNNNTFASLAVRCNFHKSMLLINAKLQGHIDRFVRYMESKNYEIDDEVLILLEENDVTCDTFNLAEYIDVPKVLGDLFEAMAGAVYLDSGKDLNVVWRVFYKIMWKEIDLFSTNVPKNVIRRLHEWVPPAYPQFEKSVDAGKGATMVPLRFMLDGHLKRVHGFGSNRQMAKKAAAKLAVRLLEQ